MSEDKIPGPALMGFTDMFVPEADIIGAIAKAAARKSAAKSAAKPAFTKGRGVASGLPRNKTVAEHGKVMHRGRVTAARAVKAVSRAKNLLTKHVAAPPLPVHLGAAATAKLTPKAQAALRKHNDAVAKSVKAAKVLDAHAKSARATAIDLAKKVLSQRAVSKSLRKPGGKARVGEYPIEVMEDYWTQLGASPDPSNPGFLDDGTPDPTYGEAAMPEADAGLDLTESPMDSPVELPPAPPMDTYIDDCDTVGGVGYDGSRGTPDGFALSYGLATRATDIKDVFDSPGIDGTRHYGYVFGRYWNQGPEKGIPFGDRLESGRWNHVHGRFIVADFASGALDPTPGKNVVDPVEAHSMRRTNPNGVAYGPIIGNPEMPTFKGMRGDAKGRLFWFPQEAPEWLTFPLKQAAALTAQAEQKAAAAAAKVEEAARVKEAADMAAEQARQDAANALAESQAASEARVVTTQTAATAAQQETQAQQELVEQAKADREAQAAAAAQEQQAGQMILEQARRREAYMAQHPEQEFGPGLSEPRQQGRYEDDQDQQDYQEQDESDGEQPVSDDE